VRADLLAAVAALATFRAAAVEPARTAGTFRRDLPRPRPAVAVRRRFPAAGCIRHGVQLSRLPAAGAALQPEPGVCRCDFRDLPDRHLQLALDGPPRGQTGAPQGVVDD